MFEGDPDVVTTATTLESIDYSIRDNHPSPTRPTSVSSFSCALSILPENPSDTTAAAAAAATATAAAAPLPSRSLWGLCLDAYYSTSEITP